jgi:hypothetical protein
MISIKELNTRQDVINLTDEEIYYIDAYRSKVEFNNDEVADEFAHQWVLRSIDYPRPD